MSKLLISLFLKCAHACGLFYLAPSDDLNLVLGHYTGRQDSDAPQKEAATDSPGFVTGYFEKDYSLQRVVNCVLSSSLDPSDRTVGAHYEALADKIVVIDITTKKMSSYPKIDWSRPKFPSDCAEENGFPPFGGKTFTLSSENFTDFFESKYGKIEKFSWTNYHSVFAVESGGNFRKDKVVNLAIGRVREPNWNWVILCFDDLSVGLRLQVENHHKLGVDPRAYHRLEKFLPALKEKIDNGIQFVPRLS